MKTLKGKTVVLTGRLKQKRADVIVALEAIGATVSTTVSQATDVVILGSRPGSKLDKARELNIPTLREEEYNSLLEVSKKPATEEKKPRIKAKKKKAARPKTTSPLEGKTLAALAGKVVSPHGKYVTFKKKELQVFVEASGATFSNSITKHTQIVISGYGWDYKAQKGVNLGAEFWSEAQLLLALEGRSDAEFPADEEFPHSVNLHDAEVLESGSSVFELPEEVEGKLILEWQKVNFPVHLRFREKYGHNLAQKSGVYLGQLYWDGVKLEPFNHSNFRGETFFADMYKDNGEAIENKVLKFEGEFGFNCSAFPVQSSVISGNWRVNLDRGFIALDIEHDDLPFGGVHRISEQSMLMIFLESKTWTYSHTMKRFYPHPEEW